MAPNPTRFWSFGKPASLTIEAVRYQRVEAPVVFNGLTSARAFFQACLSEADPSQESLWVAHLDDEAHCVHLSRHEGDACGVEFPLRTIIIDAARHGTAAILLA